MLLYVKPYRQTITGQPVGVDTGNDPFFDNVVAQLHFDGTTFTDQISSNTWTATGNASLSASAVKFGDKSLAVPAVTRSMISCTNSNFVLGSKVDFTIEAFIYLNNTAGYHVLHSSADSSTFEFAIVGGTLQVYASGGWNTFGGTTIAAGAWYHIAVTRHGGLLYAFVNGNLCPNRVVYIGEVSSSNSISIGAQPVGAQFYCLDGYIDEYRFTKGIARYTTNFGIPAAAYPDSLESGVDLLWDNVQALVQVDSTSGTLIDRSSFNRTITNNGATISSTGDETSIRVGATSDGGFSLPANVHLGNGDFTLEVTINSNIAMGGAIANHYILYKSQSFILGVDVNSIFIRFWNGSSYVGTSGYKVINIGIDYKVAVVRYGDIVAVFCDGVLLGTSIGWLNFNIPDSANPLLVGYNGDSISYFNGYIDNIRITTGVARYTRAYTPQIKHVVQPSTRDPFWDSVILSMSGDNLIDNKGKTLTVTGITVDNTIKRYGTGSLRKNSTSDKISATYTSEFDLKKDAFTIELWYCPGSSIANGSRHLISQFGTDGTRSWGVTVGPNGVGALQFYFSTGGTSSFFVGNAISSTFVANTWYHIAAVRDRYSNNFTLYLNGTKIDSKNVGDVSLFASTLPITVFATSNENFETGYFIDDIRISRYARYMSSFTPPPRGLLTS